MSQRIAPFSVNQANQVYYPGQSGYSTLQSAIDAAHAAGGGIVELQPNVSFTGTIGAAAGYGDVQILDYRTPPMVQYQWVGAGPYSPIGSQSPGGPTYAIQNRSVTATLAGDAGFTRDAGGNVNVVGKTLNIVKSDGTGTVSMTADADAATLNMTGNVRMTNGVVVLGSSTVSSISPGQASLNNTISGGIATLTLVAIGSSTSNGGNVSLFSLGSNGSVKAFATLSPTNFSTTQPITSNVGFRINGNAPSGQYLRGDGTNATFSSIQAADVPQLNQNTTGTASNVTGVVAVVNGGTGDTTPAGARINLGVGSMGTQNSNNVTITGGSANFTGASMDLGPTGAPTTLTTLDLHSSGNANDFDVRLSASGGTPTAGNGVFNVTASNTFFLQSNGTPGFVFAQGFTANSYVTVLGNMNASGFISAVLGMDTRALRFNSTNTISINTAKGQFDYVVYFIDATAGNVSVTLTDVTSTATNGGVAIFKRKDNSGNTVTISTAAALDGTLGGSFTLAPQARQWILCQNDGTVVTYWKI